MELFRRHRSKILLSVGFGLVVVAALTIIGDYSKMVAVLGNFQWWFIAPILGLVLVNYLARFIKWHYYLQVVGGGAENISLGNSAVVYLSGMSMVVTPGKLGEFIKSYLVNQLNGTPISTTAPIIMAERVTDGVSMLALASLGFFFFESTALRLVLIGILLISIAIFVVMQWRWLALKLMDWLARFALLKPRIASLHRFYESSYRLFSPKSSAIGVGLGVVGWFCECAAFYLIMLGLGFPVDAMLLLQCTFILATGTLVGSFSLLPGGLGAAEGSIGGLLALLVKGITPATASAATLLIRFCTLWFGFTIGIITLFAFRRRFERPTPATVQADKLEVPAPQ